MNDPAIGFCSFFAAKAVLVHAQLFTSGIAGTAQVTSPEDAKAIIEKIDLVIEELRRARSLLAPKDDGKVVSIAAWRRR